MTTIGLSYSLVKISTKCAPALGIELERGANLYIMQVQTNHSDVRIELIIFNTIELR